MSIREDVLSYLSCNRYKHVSVTEVGEACDLDRRQVISALHGLKKRGLGDQLENVGGGHWVFNPPQSYRIDPDENTPLEVPIGWESRFKVSARIGDWYIIVPLGQDNRDTGLRLWAKPILGGLEYDPAVVLSGLL